MIYNNSLSLNICYFLIVPSLTCYGYLIVVDLHNLDFGAIETFFIIYTDDSDVFLSSNSLHIQVLTIKIQVVF